uniref:G_PROTEIN_RECEP_F1_2 domain-containing protein n=1 Tax=Steinernema glaseri TaxID=37863 RepID=A0A1I8AV06_9BILA
MVANLAILIDYCLLLTASLVTVIFNPPTLYSLLKKLKGDSHLNMLVLHMALHTFFAAATAIHTGVIIVEMH